MHMSPLEGAKKKGCCQYIGIDPSAAAPLPILPCCMLLQNSEDNSRQKTTLLLMCIIIVHNYAWSDWCLDPLHWRGTLLYIVSRAIRCCFFVGGRGKNMYGDYSQLFGNHWDPWPIFWLIEPMKLLIHKIAAKVM